MNSTHPESVKTSSVTFMSIAFKIASALRQSHVPVQSGYRRFVALQCQNLFALHLSTTASGGVSNRYKIYTKTGIRSQLVHYVPASSFSLYLPGDGGTSSLFNGERRSKRDAYFCALGSIDELNSHLGLARDFLSAAARESIQQRSALEEVQMHLHQVAPCSVNCSSWHFVC
jgi:hypothetical protein